MQEVNCYDEWTRLEEVWIASVDGANHTIDPSFKAFFKKTVVGTEHGRQVTFDEAMLKLRAKELDNLEAVLTSLGVTVRRQQPLNFLTPFSTPYWKAYSRPCDNPRDQILVLGDTIVETPHVVRDRYFENDVWKLWLYRYYNSGCRWISAPKPMMLTSSYDSVHNLEPYSHEENSPLQGPGLEIMFDAAQILKLGQDVIMNVKDKNSALGFEWMQREFPEYKWHAVNFGPDADHLDGELTIIRPGLLLVGHNVIEDKSVLPDFMQSWDTIEMADVAEHQKGLRLASEGIHVNALMVDENNIIINEDAAKTIDALEAKGITCHAVPLHNSTVFGGGIHCSTLDIRRAGGFENYLT